jgi:hypothetical protein
LNDQGKAFIKASLTRRAATSEKELLLIMNEALVKFGKEGDRTFDVNIIGWTQSIIDDFELL